MRHHNSFLRLLMMTSLAAMSSLALMTSPCHAAALEGGETRVNSCCTAPLKASEDKDIICDTCQELVLRRGDIPAGVTTISLSSIGNLTISGDVFHHLPILRRLHLRHITHVTVESGGLRLPQDNTRVVFSAAFIGTMQLSEGALTGYWRHRSAVVLQDISKLEIASNGLSYQSSGHGPNVQFINVRALELAPGALNARIKTIWLRNVSMRECVRSTFTSMIDCVDLHNVTISQVKPMCFDRVGRLGTSSHRGVRVNSSTLGIEHSRALYGETPWSGEKKHPKSGDELPKDVIHDDNGERLGNHHETAILGQTAGRNKHQPRKSADEDMTASTLDPARHLSVATSTLDPARHLNTVQKHTLTSATEHRVSTIHSEDTDYDIQALDLETPKPVITIGGRTSIKDPYDISYDYDIVWSERTDPRLHKIPAWQLRKMRQDPDGEDPGDGEDPWRVAFFVLTGVTALSLMAFAALVVKRNNMQPQQRCVQDWTTSHPEKGTAATKCREKSYCKDVSAPRAMLTAGSSEQGQKQGW